MVRTKNEDLQTSTHNNTKFVSTSNFADQSLSYQSFLSDSSCDTNSIADSLNNLNLSILDESTVSDVRRRDNFVVEESTECESDSSSNECSSTSSSTSSSTEDFSSDDSVKDPDFNLRPDAEAISDSDEDLSPKAGCSVNLNSFIEQSMNLGRKKLKTVRMRQIYTPNNDMQPPSFEDQPTGIESQPLSPTQPPSVEREPPSVDAEQPSVDYHSPSHEFQPPSLDHQSPNIDTQPPSVDHQSPKINTQPPSVDYARCWLGLSLALKTQLVLLGMKEKEIEAPTR